MALGGQRRAERRKQGKPSWLFWEQCLEGRPALLSSYWDSRDLYFENKTIFKLFIFSQIGYFLFFFEAQKSVLWKSLTDLAVPRNRGVCLPNPEAKGGGVIGFYIYIYIHMGVYDAYKCVWSCEHLCMSMCMCACLLAHVHMCVCVCVYLRWWPGLGNEEWRWGRIVDKQVVEEGGGGEVLMAAAQPIIKEKQHSQQEAEGQ